MVQHLVKGLIGQFHELAQGLGEACDFQRPGGVGRRRQDQKHPGTVGLVSLRGVPKPVVSDLVKPSRQDVLEEAPEELNARQPLMRHALAPRSFQRKVTWVWSISRIRALVMAVRKTYRDR